MGKEIIIFNILICFVLLFLHLKFKTKMEISLYEQKNHFLLDSIIEYEKIIDEQKMNMHENKNQLRIIRRMIETENEEAKKYIDALLNEETRVNTPLLNKLEEIPYGALRALFYAKLAKLPNNYQLEIVISKTFNAKIIFSIFEKDNQDLCKIMGVILDNAIESASQTEEKLIGVDISCAENTLKIVVTNSLEEENSLKDIDKIGYTTKGEGHGYGLSLVQTILKNNPKIKNRRKIINHMFIQYVYFDLKEK